MEIEPNDMQLILIQTNVVIKQLQLTYHNTINQL